MLQWARACVALTLKAGGCVRRAEMNLPKRLMIQYSSLNGLGQRNNGVRARRTRSGQWRWWWSRVEVRALGWAPQRIFLIGLSAVGYRRPVDALAQMDVHRCHCVGTRRLAPTAMFSILPSSGPLERRGPRAEPRHRGQERLHGFLSAIS